MSKVHEYVNQEYGVTEWETSNQCLVRCPGQHLHSSRSGEKDCRLTIDANPTFHCFHESCKEVRDAASVLLRDWLEEAGELPEEGEKTPEDLARQSRYGVCMATATRWKSQLPIALATENTILVAGIKTTPEKFLSDMFSKEDVLWVGNPLNSGRHHKKHFFKNGQAQLPPGEFVSTSTYVQGASRRTKENVWERKYFVIEFDKLDPSPEENCQKSLRVLSWLRQFPESKNLVDIKAIVYSGNKSLHAWCRFPEKVEDWEILRAALPALGADPAALRPTQPVRLPGVVRKDTNKLQTLLWNQKT